MYHTGHTELVPHIYPNLNSLTLKYCIQAYFRPTFFQLSSIFSCKQFHPVLNSPRQSFVHRELSNLRHLNSPSLKYKGENKIGLKIPCTKYIKFHENSQGTSALKFLQYICSVQWSHLWKSVNFQPNPQ